MAQDWMEKQAQQMGKGDKTATKKAYYTLQRQNAEEGGNQQLSDKINSKLGKKSSSVDTEVTNKALLGAVPMLAGGAEGAAAKLIGGAAKRFAPAAVEGLEGAASKVIGGLSSKASGFIKGLKGEGAAAKAGSRAKGAVAKDFGKQASKTASKSDSKVYDLKKGGTTKEGPTNSKFNADGSRKDAMVKAGQKDKVMSSMRDAKAPASKAKVSSSGGKRSAKDVAKDFGKQAKDDRPAAPSRPRISTKEVGASSRVNKNAVTLGRKKQGR